MRFIIVLILLFSIFTSVNSQTEPPPPPPSCNLINGKWDCLEYYYFPLISKQDN